MVYLRDGDIWLQLLDYHLVIWGYMYHSKKVLTVEQARATGYQTIL